MEIPNSYVIHDTRMAKDFKGITISGYKRKDVLNAFQNSMINNKLEDAIRWLVELHATGLNNQIWASLKMIYFKYIHINNPKFLFYLLKRQKDYLNIIKNYTKKHEIFTRNNQEIRNLYAELTAISTLTKKNNIFTPKSLPTINNKSFKKEEIQKRMISKDLEKVNDFINNNITNDIKLALNEIINNLSNKNGTFQNCIYWYLWIEKIENSKKKDDDDHYNNQKKSIQPQVDPFIDHWIFILWNIILSFKDNLENKDLLLLKKLNNYYVTNFKITSISSNKYCIFISFYIIFYDIPWNTNMFQQEYLIIQSNANINKMYENIIKYVEKNLSEESKDILVRKYNKLFYTIKNYTTPVLKKVKDTNLNESVNKILFTKYPEYDTKINNDEKENNDLVFKNMTLKDIEDKKDEAKNKKIEAFTQFISYKQEKKEKIKNVLDYYNISNESNIITKNINFTKKK